MKTVAITGNIACGKSLVGNIIQERGHAVIDCDNVAHEILATCNNITSQIVTLCQDYYPQTSILNSQSNNYINRKILASIFFQNQELKSKIEKIFHPAIRQVINNFILNKKNSGAPVVFVLIPLLFETCQENNYSDIWLTYCKPATQKQRLYSRNNISHQDLDKRIKSQLPQSIKIQKSNIIIDNSGSIEMTARQVLYYLKNI